MQRVQPSDEEEDGWILALGTDMNEEIISTQSSMIAMGGGRGARLFNAPFLHFMTSERSEHRAKYFRGAGCLPLLSAC